MGETYRLYGDVLDVADCWLDVTVTTVDLDGTVHLEEAGVTDPRTWTTTLETVEQWQADDMMVALSDLADPDHAMWETICTAYEQAEQAPHGDAATVLRSHLGNTFTSLVYAQRLDG